MISAVTTYSYDVSAADALLEQAGWQDTDNNPATPRLAMGVHDVPNGTPLELNYITTGAAQRVQVSTIVADSLAQCGIQVNVKYLDQTALYAAGPVGTLFGRNFRSGRICHGQHEYGTALRLVHQFRDSECCQSMGGYERKRVQQSRF